MLTQSDISQWNTFPTIFGRNAVTPENSHYQTVPYKPPLTGSKTAVHHARAVVSFFLSEVLEEVVIKNESENELHGRHLCHVSSTDCTTTPSSSSY